MVRIVPDGRYIIAVENSNLRWVDILGEFIDNAFDAGAANVDVQFSPGQLKITDDGRGIKNVVDALTFGRHTPSSAGDLVGRYGIGMKDAWLNCGDNLLIQSTRGGEKTVMSINAQHWAENNWETEDPEVSPTDEANGTVLTMSLERRQRIATKKDVETLGIIFSPAISDGKKLRVALDKNPMLVRAAAWPQLSDSRQGVVDIDGKSAIFTIGLVAANERPTRGPIWLRYGHRILETTCHVGLGGRAVGDRLWGVITLDASWGVAKNKNGVVDDMEDLGDAIYERIADLVAAAERECMAFNTAAFREETEAMLSGALAVMREKRQAVESGQRGTVVPRETGVKRRNASKAVDATGSVRRRKSSQVRVDYIDMGEPTPFGNFDRYGRVAVLNLANPFVKLVFDEKNSAAAALAAASLCVSSEMATDDRGNTLLRFGVQDFSEGLAEFFTLTEVPRVRV